MNLFYATYINIDILNICVYIHTYTYIFWIYNIYKHITQNKHTTDDILYFMQLSLSLHK